MGDGSSSGDAGARGPLIGVRVLEITDSVAGQAAGMLLAELGADVVRVVDDPDVDLDTNAGPGHLCWNRGKRLVTAGSRRGGWRDLGSPTRARLLDAADVVIHDGAPPTLAEDGLDATHLERTRPALCSVWLPATGPVGRWSDLPADHLLLDAVSGFAAHHMATDDRPVASVVPQRHLLQGAIAAQAAVAALVGRDADGWGRHGVVSGLHAAAATLCTLVARSIDGPPMLSSGKLLPGGPNFRLYRAGDGRWLFLAALSPDLFIRALEVLDRLDVLVHPDVAGEFLNILRPEVGATVGATLEAAFSEADAATWVERFGVAGIPVALVGDPTEWLRSAEVAHACPPVEADHPELGTVTLPGVAVTLPASPGSSRSWAVRVDDPDSIWADATPHPGPDPRDRPATLPPPLEGVRLVDMSTFLAAPFVGTLLAVHGADVVKVEGPGGDPYAVFTAPYGNVNEHKRRLELDLRRDDERARFLELVASADVVVDNLVASSLERLGLTPDRFTDAHPTLVRCSITAYGPEGPFSELPGFDPVFQARSGLVQIQGGSDRPVAVASPVHDVATGALAALGTLAALRHRRRTGTGQRVETSLAASSTFLQSGDLTTWVRRPPRPVGGPDFAGPTAWHRFHRAADGWVAIAATTDAQRDACREALVPSSRAGARELAAAIANLPADAVVARLASSGVPCCVSVERDLLDDEFLRANAYAHEVDHPDIGRYEVVGGYTDWHGRPRRPPLPPERWRTTIGEELEHWAGPPDHPVGPSELAGRASVRSAPGDLRRPGSSRR